MSKEKVASEAETKVRILVLARQQGCEGKVKKIFERYENAIKGVRTEEERKVLAAMGLAEIHRTIGCVGPLVVDGVEIIPEDPSYREAIDLHKKIKKLD